MQLCAFLKIPFMLTLKNLTQVASVYGDLKSYGKRIFLIDFCMKTIWPVSAFSQPAI